MSLSTFNLSCIVAKCGNTGFGNCSLDLKNVKSGILVPKGTIFDASSLDTIVSQIQAMLVADNMANRAFMLPLIKGAEVANIDVELGTYSYGEEYEVNPAKVGRTYTFNGECQSKALAGFSNKASTFEWIPIFDGNIIAFAPTQDADEYPAVKGFAIQTLRVSPYQEVVASDVPMFTVTIVQEFPDEWNNRVTVKAIDGNLLTDLKGVQDVKLMPVKSLSTVIGVYHLKAATCGGEDFVATYGNDITITELVATSDLGANIPIISVTVTNGLLVVTLDDSDPDFDNATSFTIEGASISDMEQAGIVGYEICPVRVPRSIPTT